jgi:hypothetical protein
MTTSLPRYGIISILTIPVNSFTLFQSTSLQGNGFRTLYQGKIIVDATGNNDSKEAEEEADPPSLLVLGDAMNQELAKFRSKYPTSESDYLAAARRRSEEKPESINNMSDDGDWLAMSKAKQSEGIVLDDWEQSLVEAGNADSQILIPIVLTDDKEDGEEPKLLLF